MKILCLSSIVLLLIGCNNDNDVTKKMVKNKIIESNFINDSIYHGVTKIYDSNYHLESKITFSRGIRNGESVNYYMNGKISDSSFYRAGLKNGYNYVFDSTGQLIYINYFFYGHQFGEEFFFRNYRPYQYIFKNFEKKNIFSCGYDSIGIFAYSGEIINATIYGTTVNKMPNYGLFAYFLNPPHVQIIYSLGVIQQKTNTNKKILVFDNKKFFIDTILSIPPVGWKYYISAEYNDSLNNLKKTYISTLEF